MLTNSGYPAQGLGSERTSWRRNGMLGMRLEGTKIIIQNMLQYNTTFEAYRVEENNDEFIGSIKKLEFTAFAIIFPMNVIFLFTDVHSHEIANILPFRYI